jgi:hypothetical protein
MELVAAATWLVGRSNAREEERGVPMVPEASLPP